LDARGRQGTSLYLEPFLDAGEIAFVKVNGSHVVEGGKSTGVRPGKALRHGRTA
jgi:hypothetical protein